MCGATGQQTTIQNEQMQMFQQAQDMLKQEYGNQQAIFGPMAAKFGSIFAAGPSQEGFAPEEKQNLETGVIEGTAGNYAQAARAVSENIAANGGVGMPSGAADEMKLETSLSAAQEKSREEREITAADYATGRQNWMNAGQGLLSIAAGENPLGYEQGATEAGSQAANTANQIASQQNSWINAALGLGGSLINANPHNVFG